MKTPQLEDGFLRIALEIVDEFQKLHLSGNEWQVLWVVLRKTYGWHKKEDYISLTQFQKETGLHRFRVSEAIKSLVTKSLLVVNKQGYTNTYSFNKRYSKWNSHETVTSHVFVQTSHDNVTGVVTKTVPKLVTKTVHTIDNIDTNTKDTIQKIYTSLENLSLEDFEEIANKYQVPLAFVMSKFDDLSNWINEKPTRGRGRNLRMTLMNWVKRDAVKIATDERRIVNKLSVTQV